MSGLFKVLQPVFNILFYAAVFFIVLSLILSIILVFVNVDTAEMLLPPFMSKLTDDAGQIASYEISFGNGIKIVEDASNVALDDIKAVLFAGIFVLVCTLLTVAPIFRFLSLLLKNVNGKNFFDRKNPRYVMYIGLCVFVGTLLIRFMMRFYNYYLAVRFMKDIAPKIHLSLGIDILSGLTGLVILFIGFVFAYIFDRRDIVERK
ncbi:MAG: DUF2975 domain-containing protein [Oscillospiraceae bacterium]|nr:DUF2975 domain-containing protein [Oscillospiraceae bacterium]